MTPERYRQIDEIFHAALGRPAAERAGFLEQLCQDDAALRNEVEALLQSHEEAGSFIESPVVEAADLLTFGQTDSFTGRNFGPYKIIEKIGAGGMGEVYLAHDKRLDRQVALKILPTDFTSNSSRLARFRQEARAASALNHPNILTIFDIGQAEEIHFMVTEFISGVTLRRYLANVNISLSQALDVAIQIANALSAAHEAGIVHRDIKPENVMLRPDGYVKVLDFGLAKQTGQYRAINSDGTLSIEVITQAGMIIGTPGYMSPEQVRGLAVDARTDIFSLGAMLYEMIAGCAPFREATSADTMSAVLHKQPPPLAHHKGYLPDALEQIVNKALTKEREQRYQTAKALLNDLKQLKSKLDFEAEKGHSPSPGIQQIEVETVHATLPDVGRTMENVPQDFQKMMGMSSHPAAKTRDTVTHTTSSAEIILSEIKRHKKGAAIILATLVIMVAAIAFGIYKFVFRNLPSVPFQTMNITRLTSTGKAVGAAISPDGKYVVYVMDEAGKQSLWLRQAVTNSNVQIIPPTEGISYRGPAFSHDGNYIYYLKKEREEPRATLYQMPVLGGEPKKLLTDISIQDTGSNFSFSPDGKQLALIRLDEGFNRSLVVVNVDGTGERKIASRLLPNFLAGAAWSPDGKTIAYVEGSFMSGGRGGNKSFTAVRVEDGKEKPISSQKWALIFNFVWLPEGSGLVIAATERAGTSQLWHLSYPSGEARRITNDLNGYESTSLTANTSTLVTVRSDFSSNIWIAPGSDTSHARQVTSSSGDYNELNWTPGGKIVYQSARYGISDIWIMNADGTGQKQLTADSGTNTAPTVSPDGRYIIFLSDQTGQSLWRMDIDGSNPMQLIKNASVGHCTPDSRWVVYYEVSAGGSHLWKISIDGGDPVQLTFKDLATRSCVSPDGRLIACNYLVQQPNSQFRIAILPIEGGEPIRIFNIPTSPPQEIHWTPDGIAVAYIVTREGISNIWAQPIDGSPAKQLTDFKADFIYSFNWSHDGKLLACSRGPRTSDVVLISDFK